MLFGFTIAIRVLTFGSQLSCCLLLDAGLAALILFLVAKCTIAGGTLIIFQYGGELFPTEVRGIGIGLASFLGGIGLSIIPFINYLGTQWLFLPIIIMGAFSVVGGYIHHFILKIENKLSLVQVFNLKKMKQKN